MSGNRDTITITQEEYNRLTNKVNFSNQEQAIGTWTNGKTLYRQLYTGSIPVPETSFSEVTSVIGNLPNKAIAVDYNAKWKSSDLNLADLPFVGASNNSGNVFRLDAQIVDGKVSVRNGNIDWSGTAYVWVCYYYND